MQRYGIGDAWYFERIIINLEISDTEIPDFVKYSIYGPFDVKNVQNRLLKFQRRNGKVVNVNKNMITIKKKDMTIDSAMTMWYIKTVAYVHQYWENNLFK